MTQKQLITANNAELEKHKQDILSLPMADVVKNGKYVWKKYEYTPAETIQVINPKSTLTYYKSDSFKVSSDDYNVNSVDISFFNGFTLAVAKYNQYIINDGYVTINGRNIEVVYDKTNAILTVKGVTYSSSDSGTLNYNGIKTYEKEEKIGGLIGYIVSDLETAYPDGGEKDGYWYERVACEKYGVFIHRLTEDGYPVDITVKKNRFMDHEYYNVPGNLKALERMKIDTAIIEKNSFYNAFSDAIYKGTTNLWISKKIEEIKADNSYYPFKNCSGTRLKIYMEQETPPVGWHDNWRNYSSSSKYTVVYGVTEEQFDAL